MAKYLLWAAPRLSGCISLIMFGVENFSISDSVSSVLPSEMAMSKKFLYVWFIALSKHFLTYSEQLKPVHIITNLISHCILQKRQSEFPNRLVLLKCRNS